MRIGLNYWNVVSHHPDVFRELAAALLAAGHEVHVVSAIGKNRAGTIKGEVAVLGIPVTAVHEVVFTRPRESPALKTGDPDHARGAAPKVRERVQLDETGHEI